MVAVELPTPSTCGDALMTRRFGIELELEAPDITTTGEILKRNDIGVIINPDCDIPKRDKRRYTVGANGKWRVTEECDCPDGCELVSPIFESDDSNCFAALEYLYNVLTSNDEFSIDEYCGLHVHVEAKEFNALSLAAVSRAAYKFRNTLDGYALRESQLDLGWLEEQIDDIVQAGPVEGREAIISNWYDEPDSDFLKPSFTRHGCLGRDTVGLESWQRQGTIEYRQCAATFNYHDIYKWIQIVIGITDWAANQSNNWPDLNQYEDQSQDLSQLIDMALIGGDSV